MKEQDFKINAGGVNGFGMKAKKMTDDEYKELQAIILKEAAKQTPEQKMDIQSHGIMYQMQSYVSDKNTETVITVGEFIKRHLKAINIKNKDFAKYIGIEESNLSAIINGRRKITTELALKLGQVFVAKPSLWLRVQYENELKKVRELKAIKEKTYNAAGLLAAIQNNKSQRKKSTSVAYS